MNKAIPYWLHAISPLHIGAGTGAGAIDLPVVREKATGWPYIPGSSVKGVVADLHSATETERTARENLRRAFGKAGDGTAQAGALSFADARLVCLAVQSLLGTWAWVTSPMALRRLKRDLEVSGVRGLPRAIPSPQAEIIRVPDQPASVLVDAGQQKAWLLDLDPQATADPDCTAWAKVIGERVFPNDAAEQALFGCRFAVAHDDIFNGLTRTGMEIVARVKIDDKTGTVSDGQLWYEESVPAESILAGIVFCDGVRAAADTNGSLLDEFCSDVSFLQFGGKATIGRGRARCIFPPRKLAGGTK